MSGHLFHRAHSHESIDQGGRRIALLGSINDSRALLLAERAAFPSDLKSIETVCEAIVDVKNLGNNDIYRWYLASSDYRSGDPPGLKLNLIYPCTEQHIKKYSPQQTRMVTETPQIYHDHVRPYIQKKRDEGRLNWVYNILEGRSEQEDVLLRDLGHSADSDEGFLLLPDLNWDRKTVTSLHLLGLVERRDIWSLRDLRKSHVEWLKHMREKIIDATVRLYSDVELDMLKLYVHCKITPSLVSHPLHYFAKLQISRPANILPLSYPRRPCHARGWRHPSRR